MNVDATSLYQQLDTVLAKDRFRLQQNIRRLLGQQRKQGELTNEQFSEFAEQLSTSQEAVNRRRQSIPAIEYPQELPVVEQKLKIFEAIRDNQVVIIAGETGSGKTTQIPKICLELGLGSTGFIGHTQPRRLAARTVANRIAEELKSPLGEQVGYKIRFNDKIKPSSLVKLMTDGMLLAEMQQDRFLSQYQVLIIDEAHERSLNIDFLLGLLTQLLAKRPDLKLIITSATIDPQRFSKHFGDAPMIEVSGRTFPVETRYRPLNEGSDNKEVIEGISDAIDELYRESRGDILIFMNGEREIRDAADFLQKRQLPNTDILPLYSRLSNAEQNRIFASHSGRRIVLSTNVAETSLTVPGIRYVIDPGTARISRYSYRSKVQRLPIEAVSQASANQRKGRCGRVAEGICIRLYSEDDFDARPEFTDPEILRTNLASVILQMLALKLGDIAAFPFIDPPDQRNIKDGLLLLEELGAVKAKGSDWQLSQTGREIAKFPVDPRMARMLVAAKNYGCVQELLVICAALSIQDPRERPLEKQQAADQAHQRFHDADSDFTTYLKLWDYLQTKQNELGSSQFRKLCKKEFLAYMRLREWQDIYFQLSLVVKELNYPVNAEPASDDNIHQAITAGLLSHFGFKDKEREFLGARNARFLVFPGSGLAKKPPKWIVASELVETSRLFARNVAKIQPQWLEAQAGHLIKRNYSEPHWSTKQLSVMAYETQRLYGVAIVNRRKVNYSQVDPILSREIFIRSALVEAQWPNKHQFFAHNQALLADVENLEEKQRRRDIRIDDQSLFEFYDHHLPDNIVTARHFNTWWNKTKQQQPNLLNFDWEMLHKNDSSHVTIHSYPDHWQLGKIQIPLTYIFDPRADDDGVSAHIPLALLNQINYTDFEWQIPAMRNDLVIALIKSLPKPIRKNVVPAPQYAQAALDSAETKGRLLDQISKQLLRMTGLRIAEESWNWENVPKHLLINFKVINDKNELVAQGRDYPKLQTQLSGQVEQSLAELVPNTSLEQDSVTQWDFGRLPEQIQEQRQGYEITAYPALVDKGSKVALKLFDKPAEAQWQQQRGLSKLVQLNVPSPLKYLQQHLPNKAKLGLYFNPFGKVENLIEDCSLAVIDQACSKHKVADESEFKALVDKIRADMADHSLALATKVEEVLSLHYMLAKKLKGKVGFELVMAHADIKSQLQGLIYKGFVRETGANNINDVKRYLQAIEKRLEKLVIDPHKDKLAMQQIEHASSLVSSLKLEPYQTQSAELKQMLEELRVSLFAQQLGTRYPVSVKRVNNRVNEIAKELKA